MDLDRDNAGFSTVEVIVVTLIFSLLATLAVPKVADTYRKYSYVSAFGDLQHAIRFAQLRSMAGEGDDVFSIRLNAGAGGSFILFKGTDFGGRDTAYDETYALPGFLALSDTIADDDIIFERVTGKTADTGSISINWTGAGQIRTISLNAAGAVDTQ